MLPESGVKFEESLQVSRALRERLDHEDLTEVLAVREPLDHPDSPGHGEILDSPGVQAVMGRLEYLASQGLQDEMASREQREQPAGLGPLASKGQLEDLEDLENVVLMVT